MPIDPRLSPEAPQSSPRPCPSLVAYARASLAILDKADALHSRLQPTGGIIGKIAITARRWLGNTDIDRLDLLANDPLFVTRCDDDPFYRQMAQGVADALYVPSATTRAFMLAARRDAYDIIARYEVRNV